MEFCLTLCIAYIYDSSLLLPYDFYWLQVITTSGLAHYPSNLKCIYLVVDLDFVYLKDVGGVHQSTVSLCRGICKVLSTLGVTTLTALLLGGGGASLSQGF